MHIDNNKSSNHEASILHLNCDKSNTILNWYPTWDFNQTIVRTVNWYIGFLEGKNPIKLTELDIDKFLK